MLNTVTALPARPRLTLPGDSYVASLEAQIIALYAKARTSRTKSAEVPRAEAKAWAQARALYLAHQAQPEEPYGDDWRPDAFLTKAWRAISALSERQLVQLQHPSRCRSRVAQQLVLDGPR